MKKYFQKVYDFYTRYGFKKPKGASNKEIEQLEAKLGFKLSVAYKEYLKFMGNDYKGALCGTDCFINERKIDKDSLEESLKLNELKVDLPQDFLVFFNHQGYYLAWFELNIPDENPKCFYYMEDDLTELKESTFSEFMTKEILSCAKITMELGKHKPWWKLW